MGSSQATTPAGRRRSARRAARAAPKRVAAKRPPQKPAARKPARPAPKKRKPAAKPKASRPGAKRLRIASLRTRGPMIGAAAAAIVVLLAAGYQFWLRNSPLVAVEDIAITGMRGPEREPVEAALRKAAGEMTTLNADRDALLAAVAAYPTVVGVEADADFPHGLAVTVEERPPVLLARSGTETQPIAGDGTVLRGVATDGLSLPEIGVAQLPAKGKLAGDALEIALVLGAAPGPLRELVTAAEIGGPEGVQMTLRGDIPLYFGGADRTAEKWAAAAAVLADPKIEQLTYLDLRVPERPAVGGAAPSVTEETTETTEPETGPAAAATPP